MTSHTAVAKLRRLFGGVKAGHTGTLDPMATGVLPVLLGRAVKASAFLTESDKHYRALLRLGLTADTEGTTGRVLTECDTLPGEEEVREVCRRFVGKIMQTPPMYSAIRVGGVRLMEMARRGEVVEREAREIEVFSLSVERVTERDYSLDVVCSKGTYIRTLCADIGAMLGCGGCMAALERRAAAGFGIGEAHTLGELEAMGEEERAAAVIPTEHLFRDLPAVRTAPFFTRLAQNGQPLYQKKIGCDYPRGTRVRLLSDEGFYALAEVGEDTRLTVIRLFVLGEGGAKDTKSEEADDGNADG